MAIATDIIAVVTCVAVLGPAVVVPVIVVVMVAVVVVVVVFVLPFGLLHVPRKRAHTFTPNLST